MIVIYQCRENNRKYFSSLFLVATKAEKKRKKLWNEYVNMKNFGIFVELQNDLRIKTFNPFSSANCFPVRFLMREKM